MKPELIEQFFQQTPEGLTVRISMPGQQLYVKVPSRKAANFGDGCYYIEVDAKDDLQGVYRPAEILIDSSNVTNLTRMIDTR